MQNITYILDLEYFSSAKPGREDYFFGYREVALLRCDRLARDPWIAFTPVWPGRIPLENSRIRQTINWERNLSRLEYSPDLRYPFILHEDVKAFLKKHIGDLPFNCFIGYKGGQAEQQLLDELGYRSINLELLNCPKLSEILNTYPELEELARCYNCGFHMYNRRSWWLKRNGDVPVHCAAVEVFCFNYWLQHNL